MARNIFSIAGSGHLYTVPAGKVAKVLLDSFEGNSANTSIGGTSFPNMGAVSRTSTNEVQVSPNDALVGVNKSMAREYILAPGQKVSVGGNTITAVIIEDDI